MSLSKRVSNQQGRVATRKYTEEKEISDKIANLMHEAKYKNEKMHTMNAKMVREAKAELMGKQTNEHNR